jgi:hypothetical protein
MTRHTRYFMFGAIAVLLVGLCTGLIAYYAGLPMGAFSQDRAPQELTYVPGDSALVAYVDVQDVMRSELRQRVHKSMPHREQGQEQFERETGINLEQDIDRVVAFLMPGAEQERYSGMMIATGRFDAVRLEGLAREHGGSVEEYRGKRLISRAGGPDGRSMTVAFLQPGVVAVGDTVSVRRAIDGAGGQNITTNQELMGLVRDVDQGNAWAVGRFDALVSRANLPQGVANQIPPIQWFSATGRVNGGVSGQFRAETGDEQSAQNLRDVVNGFLALARLQASSQPELQVLVNSVQVSGTGRTVAMSFSLPVEVIEALGAIGGSRERVAPPDGDLP